MSMAILLKGVLATDSQMMHNIRDNDEYTTQGQKLFISPCKRAAFALVGSELDSIELALVWQFIVPRLAAFYLSYESGNPLEFSDDERALLGGTSAKSTSVMRRLILVTQTHAWAICRDFEVGASIIEIDPTKYWTDGSECNMSNVYYVAGFDAAEIIQRLTRISNTCGGAPQVLKLSTLVAFDRSVTAVKKSRKKPVGVKA